MKNKLLCILVLAVMLLSSFTLAQAQTYEQYDDVFQTEWFYEAVDYVSSNKVMTGTAQGKFAPRDKLTRGHGGYDSFENLRRRYLRNLLRLRFPMWI